MFPDLGKGLMILAIVAIVITSLVFYLLGMGTTRTIDLSTHQVSCTNYNKHGDCIEGIVIPK